MYTFTLMILSLTSSVNGVLNICVLSGSIIWIGQPIGVLFPEEGHFSHSWHSLVAYNSLCRVAGSWKFLYLVGMFILVQNIFDNHLSELWVSLLLLLGDVISKQTLSSYRYSNVLSWWKITLLFQVTKSWNLQLAGGKSLLVYKSILSVKGGVHWGELEEPSACYNSLYRKVFYRLKLRQRHHRTG